MEKIQENLNVIRISSYYSYSWVGLLSCMGTFHRLSCIWRTLHKQVGTYLYKIISLYIHFFLFSTKYCFHYFRQNTVSCYNIGTLYGFIFYSSYLSACVFTCTFHQIKAKIFHDYLFSWEYNLFVIIMAKFYTCVKNIQITHMCSLRKKN